MPAFTLGTWNILATGYIRAAFYPDTPREFLDPHWRIPAIAQRLRELSLDIVCLQEVERAAYAAINEALQPLGYSSSLEMKAGRKPDGCATFVRAGCAVVSERRLEYADAFVSGPNSGHIAQLLTLEIDGARIALVNTHLKWDAPDTPRERQWGYRQIGQVLQTLNAEPAPITIICGDFNATPDSGVVAVLRESGFDYAHRGLSSVYTCNSNREAKLIDYIFSRGPIRAEALPVRTIGDRTPLPSPEEPSDHLPLIARFTTYHSS
jgi:mRNA deadenylase 3'-5' endonuclease subunit Ccr4